ncbi:MAG: outer membrane beta-barrel protein [Marinosulfonomonas sp.]|nr:outer membrane beta-barrel protein [Marinosulfonomonas sp.]
MRFILTSLFFATIAPFSAFAQAELSFYGGMQSARSAIVSGNDPAGIGAFSFDSGWKEQPFDFTRNFGLRLTWWRNDDFGWGIDMSHAETKASDSTLSANGLNRLVLSDGLNLVTLNTYRRWRPAGRLLRPYVGAGVGLAVPNIEFDSGSGLTTGHQLTGPAIQWLAGASIPVGDRLSVFGEYRGSLAANSADLLGGGNLNASILTNALNVGVSLGF